MDFHNMKRKQLQALCKKHKIPANLSNLEMANKLAEFLKEKEDPLVQWQQEENANETEPTNVVVDRKVKKVRFSPEHELIEFTKSREMKRRSSRNSLLSRKSSWLSENVNSGQMNNENVGGQGRITRSRGLKSMEENVNEKKRGINVVKCDNEKTNASAVEIFDNGKLKEGDVDSSGGEMMPRGKMLEEGIKDASKRGRKRATDDDKRDEKAVDNIDSEKNIQEIVGNPGRLTRSRVQKLTEASVGEEKGGRKVLKGIGDVALVRDDNDQNRVASMSSFSNGGDVGEGKMAKGSGELVKSNGKRKEEDLEDNKIAGEHDVSEPQIFLRRSKRNAKMVADSEILNGDTRKHETGDIKGSRIISKLLAEDGSGVDAESNRTQANLGGKEVPEVEEPTKVEPRRSNRRKNVIESDELKAETENQYPFRGSVQQLRIGSEVFKADEKVLQATVVMGRSRRKTLSLKLVSADEEIDIDSAVENLEAEKYRSKPCRVEKECSAFRKNTRRSTRNTSKCKSPGLLDGIGGDSIIHQKNEVMKRKRGPISGGDVVKTKNAPNFVAQSMNGSSSKRAVPAAASGKVASKNKRSRLNDRKMLDAFALNGLEFGKPVPNISVADSVGSSDMKLISGKELVNPDINAASRITELRTDPTDFEDRISASNIRGVEKGHSPLELDVHEVIEQNITDMAKNDPETGVFSRVEDSGCDNKIDDQVLPEGSNVSRKEGFAETGSPVDSIFLGDQTDIKADLGVAEAEADKCLRPTPSLVDHVEVKGISLQENLGFDETRRDNEVLPVGSNVSGKEGFSESSPTAEGLLIGDQTDIKTNLEVAEAEADKCLQPNPCVVDHVGGVRRVSVQENPDSDKTRQDRVLSDVSNVSGKEGFAEAGSSTDSLSHCNQLDIKTDLELAVAEGDKCLQPRPCVVDHVGEVKGITVQENLDSHEIRQDDQALPEGSIVSGNDGFPETGCSADSLAMRDQTDNKTDLEVAEAEADKHIRWRLGEVDHIGEVKEDHKADHILKREDIYNDKSINPVVGANIEGGSSKGQKSNCDEDREFCLSNLFDAEGKPEIMPHENEIFSGEHSIKDFDEQGVSHGSSYGAPTTVHNCIRDHEVDLIAKEDENYIYKEKQSDLSEPDESGCLTSHKSSQDENWEFNVSNLFDGEKSARIITPQDRGTVSAEYSFTELNKHMTFPDFPAVSATCANSNEVKLGADISILQEESPSKPNSVSGSQAEQPKSPLAKATAVANTIQREEAQSNVRETAGNAMCLLKTNAEGNISQIGEGLGTEEDANDADCGKDKEEFAGACITDVEISTDCTISKMGVGSLTDMKFQDTEETEQQCRDLLARQTEPVGGAEPTDVVSRQSWTEIELHNLFATTLNEDTPGLNETSSQRTETANPTMSTNKWIANTGGSLTKKKMKEMEGERIEFAEAINKNVVLATNYEEVSHTGTNVDSEENELNFLFATPVKVVAPCKTDETYPHERKLDGTVMLNMECFDTRKENAVIQNTSDEKVHDAEYELENSLCLGDPLSDNGNDVACEESNEVESVQLVNTSNTVHSEAQNDGCETSKEQLTEKCLKENKLTEKCLKETKLLTEEDKEEKVIPLGQSCLYDEATDHGSESREEHIIDLSGSSRNLVKLECCQDLSTDTNFSESSSCKNIVYHKSERELQQSSEAAFELADADLQKSHVPENSHHITACFEDSNISKETSVETFRAPLDAEVAKIGSLDGQNDVIDKGTSPCLSSKASTGHDEEDGNPNSSQVISDALHNLSQEADKLPCSSELESTYKEPKETGSTTQNVDDIVATAEYGSFIFGAEPRTLSSSAMHLHPGDHEIGDIEKLEAESPVLSFEANHEKEKGKSAEENSAANRVHFSVHELHFEEKFINDIHAISDVPASGCNEILKESDVADTIKEYIDSESSLSVIFENSSSSLPIDALTQNGERTACKNAALCKYEEEIAGKLANSESEDGKPLVDCLETESKEPGEATLFESAPGTGKAVKSPACADFLAEGYTANKPLVETKGSIVKLESQKPIESEDGSRSSSKELCSTAKKNARTILIHGTPGKLRAMADMKENPPRRKDSSIGDLTTVRPAKRRALQDVQWK